ncbi:MAG: ABC transporter substrate-binding protein [Verrucomicrobiota bacterium JB024]|nr:ABC transporter substrate-binding protein [Verrucomicrobiota bacterium JB024]
MPAPRVLIFGVLFVGIVVFGFWLGETADDQVGGDRIVIEYWEKWTGPERQAMADLVDEFNASQDRVYVKFLSVSSITRKLMLATAGGNPPDVAGIWAADLPVFSTNGALTPLNPYAERAGIEAGDYLPSVWAQLVVYDRLWALPTTPSANALHWNKRLFREAGLDPDKPPRTIAELEAYNDRITRFNDKGDIVVLGHLPTEPGWWNANWSFWFGGDVWNGEDAVTATGEANMAALDWIASYPERYGVGPLLGFRQLSGVFASPENPFFRGRVAMALQGPWMYNFIQNFAPEDFEWGVAPFPSLKAENYGTSLVECDCLVIPRGAKHPEEAFAFIAWLQEPAQMERLCLAQLKFSPLAQVSENFYARHPNPHIRVYRELAESPLARFRPQMLTFNEFSADMGSAIDDIMRGAESPEQAAEILQERQQGLFRRKYDNWQKVREERMKEWDQQ